MDSKGTLRTVSTCACAITLLAVLSPASAQIQEHVRLQFLGPTEEDTGFTGENGPERTFFGSDVAIRNGLAFIGITLAAATGSTGRVAVFTRGATEWTRTATITASDKTTGDRFGRAVSYRDGLLVVGSDRAAYVYKQVNGAWREQQKIVPAAADGVRTFSIDIRHEAGVLAIGAFGNDTTRDSVYVFEQDASRKFVRRARITASGGHLGDGFGVSISMTNRMIVVGAPGGGAAYILGRNSSGNWVQRQKLVTVDAADGFGSAVAVDRDMILVGAPASRVPGEEPALVAGAVYGFLPGATRYLESFRLLPPDAPPDSDGYLFFGSAIAMFGDRIAIDASEGDTDPAARAIMTTYSREGSSVRLLGYVMDNRVAGTSIAIANHYLLGGSPTQGRNSLFVEVGIAGLYHLNRFTQ